MKLKLFVLSVTVLLATSGYLIAQDHSDHDHGSHGEHATDVVKVNNKVCPVSGEEIGSMGEGFTVEYDGKEYNLCCKMCKRKFLQDPEKYIANLAGDGEAVDHEDHDHSGHNH